MSSEKNRNGKAMKYVYFGFVVCECFVWFIKELFKEKSRKYFGLLSQSYNYIMAMRIFVHLSNLTTKLI